MDSFIYQSCIFPKKGGFMAYEISFTRHPHAEDIQLLNKEILKEHKIKMDMKPLESFAYFIRDDQEKILGGCAGESMYGGLKELRRKGHGTHLMSLVEDLARKSQCRFITVNTFGWEALDFYKNLGFFEEFARHGYDKDSIFFFLRKNLD